VHKAAWVVQILLAVAFLGAGSMKLVNSRAELLRNPAMAWAEDFSETQITLIGLAELAGAVGLVVPAAIGVMPGPTALAARALAVLMAGAVVTHIRRGEPPYGPLVLAILALLVVYLRRRAAMGAPAVPDPDAARS
jgi:hypothetical protein